VTKTKIGQLVGGVAVALVVAVFVIFAAGGESGRAELSSVSANSTPVAPRPATTAVPSTAVPEKTTAPSVSAVPAGEAVASAPVVIPTPSHGTPSAEQTPVVLPFQAEVDAVAYPADMQGPELENAREWMQTQFITAQCMSEKGFAYTFSPYWEGSAGWWPSTLPSDQQAAAAEALDGAPDRGLGDDYRWDEAGCYGYAVHVMGNDDAN